MGVADWAATRLGLKQKTAQNDGYGQKGRNAMHILVMLRLATGDDDIPNTCKGQQQTDMLFIHRMVVVTDESNFGAVDTAAIIESSLNLYSKLPSNEHLRTVTLKTDMAKDYSGVSTMLTLFSNDSFIRSGKKIRITTIYHSEPGEVSECVSARVRVGQ
jgi:hypothetical protein